MDERHASEEFYLQLLKLIREFMHEDWDITVGEIIGQLEVAKAVVLKVSLEDTDEESDQDGDD